MRRNYVLFPAMLARGSPPDIHSCWAFISGKSPATNKDSGSGETVYRIFKVNAPCKPVALQDSPRGEQICYKYVLQDGERDGLPSSH